MTDPLTEREAADRSILAALADEQPTWVTLAEAAPSALLTVIDDFNAGERPAARAATQWLKNDALGAHATSRTRLLISRQRVAGFYSLASAQVSLSQRDRRKLDLSQDLVTLPAALVTWIARDPRSEIDGTDLLRHAVATACKASKLQAVALIVVDPYDQDTDRMWRQRGFRPSSDSSRPFKRLWMPLT